MIRGCCLRFGGVLKNMHEESSLHNRDQRCSTCAIKTWGVLSPGRCFLVCREVTAG